MRLKLSCLGLLFVFLCCANVAYPQESLGPGPKKARTPEDYKPRTLKEIADLGSPTANERDDYMKGDATTLVHGDLLPSRVRVTYKGPSRSLPQKKRDVISQWANRYAGSVGHYTLHYTTDVMFSEAGLNHWLVVNKRLLPRLKRELRVGRSVDLHLIRMGAYKIGDKWRWVLLVEDFAKPN